MEEDAAANKRTTVVLFGRRFALWWYFVNGVVAVLLLFPCLADFGIVYILLPAIVYLFLHIKTGLAIKQRVGEALIPLLGATARNLLVFTILVSVVWICKGLRGQYSGNLYLLWGWSDPVSGWFPAGD